MRSRLALALALACAATALVAVPATAPAATLGPKGDAFYKPPKPLPGKSHGDPIWTRRLSSSASLPAASRGMRVLYRSKSVAGDAIAVSGIVLLPEGRPPKGGWPVVSWGHGTIGIADACAFSRMGIRAHDYGRETIGPLWSGYLRAGYAVVQSDLEGLGTPGHHPFLIGRSEARGVLDIVRAARKLDSRVGRRIVLAGHSQGGHAVLWGAGEAARWTSELRLLATHAFAPIAKASPLAVAREALTSPGGLSTYAGLVSRALDTVVPSLDVSDYFTDRAMDLYPLTTRRCLTGLGQEDAYGGISVADMFRDDADGDALVALVERHIDLNRYKLGAPVLVFHGTADNTIPVQLSDQMVEDLREAGTRVVYKRYEGAGHTPVVDRGRAVAVADAKRRR